jgi:hypothetical protein
MPTLSAAAILGEDAPLGFRANYPIFVTVYFRATQALQVTKYLLVQPQTFQTFHES